jgi:hypothetical protein
MPDLKKKIYPGICFVILFFWAGISFNLYLKNNRLKEEINRVSSAKEKEFRRRISEERDAIRKDLEERYSADRVSFAAMAKRMEIEKKRMKSLEEEIKTLKNTTHSKNNKRDI